MEGVIIINLILVIIFALATIFMKELMFLFNVKKRASYYYVKKYIVMNNITFSNREELEYFPVGEYRILVNHRDSYVAIFDDSEDCIFSNFDVEKSKYLYSLLKTNYFNSEF